jgi:hypothetical protein
MKLVEINWTPSVRQLRQFALLCLIALPTMGWLWGANSQVIGVLFGIAVLVALAGWWRPNFVRPLFVGIMLIAVPLGMIVGELAMLLIYVGVFLPISVVFRLLRRDALQLRMHRNRDSHWQSKHQPSDVSSYFLRY